MMVHTDSGREKGAKSQKATKKAGGCPLSLCPQLAWERRPPMAARWTSVGLVSLWCRRRLPAGTTAGVCRRASSGASGRR